MHTVVELIVYALAMGGIYALFALGYNLVFGILGMMHLAFGDALCLAVFVILGVKSLFGLPLYLALIIGIVAGGVISILVEFSAYRPLRFTNNRMAPVISALGMAYVLRNTITLGWGVSDLPFPKPIPGWHLMLAGIKLSASTFATLGVTILAIVCLTIFLRYTKWGLAIRSVAQDISAASLMGVPKNRIILFVYFISGTLGVIGGILYANIFEVVFVELGWQALWKAFYAAIMGGIGSLAGGCLAGLLLGLLETFVGYYLSTTYRDAIVFAILIALLIFRPEGLMGRKPPVKV